MDYNGFDSFLALRGINCDDKKEFFEGIEESVRNLQDFDENDKLRKIFEEILAANYQRINNFRLKIGHKNLIINLCRELQSTTITDFNSNSISKESEKFIPQETDEETQIDEKFEPEPPNLIEQPHLKEPQVEIHEAPEITGDDSEEMVQYIYESDGEGETIQFTEQDQDFLETYDQDNEVVEMVYEEVPHDETENDENLYMSEDAIKSEDSSVFDLSNSKNHLNIRNRFKRPKHMYTEEFLATQKIQGRIGTPGKRRPKLKKHYPDTEEGLIERWSDLVRQSLEVIVPQKLLEQFDLRNIEVIKTHELTWEVKCPMCSKKVKLQMTYEGKYINYKRSNFERHLRVIHYRQIEKVKDKLPSNRRNDEIDDEHEY